VRAADRGSTIPLVIGFFVVAGMLVAASVALGDAFVQQRGLQDLCDGAAAAAVAQATNLDREIDATDYGSGPQALTLSRIEPAVTGYLDRDVHRSGVRIRAELSPDGTRLTLSCRRTSRLAFGALFGHGRVEHATTSSARAAVRP
jgi:hypothetical protein